ncbi:MAG: hypothetical protein ABIZ64_17845 [Casimicrobium sp.]
MPLHPAALLALYDDTMRRNVHIAGCEREITPVVTRCTTTTGSQRYIMWHDFRESGVTASVDAEFSAVRGHAKVLMWKLYAHDSTHDELRDSLVARGCNGNDHCTLMATPVRGLIEVLAAQKHTSSSLAIRELVTSKELDAYQNIWDDVWPDAPNSRYVDDYRALIERREPGIAFFAGFDGDNPVTSGYMFHAPGAPFALLCGGTTKAAWRRQHAYTGMLTVRAHAALERGAQYLAVEASPESKPILERLGFKALSTLSFYEKHID